MSEYRPVLMLSLRTQQIAATRLLPVFARTLTLYGTRAAKITGAVSERLRLYP